MSTDAAPEGLRKRNWFVLGLIGLTSLLTISVAVVLGAWSLANYRFVSPSEIPETVFVVPDGAGINSVAGKLEREGLIDSASIYKAVMRFRDPDAKLVPGEFAIPAGASMEEITEVLKSGKVILYRLTIPEGRTTAQVLRAVEADEVLVGDTPELESEGVLLPETYTFPRGTTRAQIVEQMRDAQDSALAELWAGREAGLPLDSPEEALILASIVEKETGMDGERAEVAGVFVNRLRRGMRLESDPTIIYGISKGEPLGRGLRRSEIDRRTDWNTYQIDGLPPTPIANPGREAIAAVLRPADTDALFFVADGTGGHVFARTYAEHLRNVRKWRQIEAEMRRRQRENQ